MSKNKHLNNILARSDAEFQARNTDAVMSLKYYGGALSQVSRKCTSETKEMPYPGLPVKPEDFGKTIGDRPFTANEYLNFLGEQGFNIDELKADLATIDTSIHEMRAKAKAFFKIFQTEWFIEQSDFEKYLDHHSIHHFIELVVADSASTKARLKAIKGHTKNHADKAKVFDWCDRNMSNFSSMDDAAFDIAETFIPQKFRAVRDWMTEWKKLRSASTP